LCNVRTCADGLVGGSIPFTDVNTLQQTTGWECTTPSLYIPQFLYSPQYISHQYLKHLWCLSVRAFGVTGGKALPLTLCWVPVTRLVNKQNLIRAVDSYLAESETWFRAGELWASLPCKQITQKSAVFWDVMPCVSCKNRHFERKYRLHQQGGKNQRVSKNVSSNSVANYC
jgi:hypothetical protein